MIQRRRLFIPTVPLSDPHRRLRPLLGQLRPLSTSNGSGKEAPPAPAPVDGDGGIVTREEAYRQIHDLDFMKAAKILFTTPPKRKQFGFDFHLVQFFFVCMPSLAVYLVAQYARYEIRRMEAVLLISRRTRSLGLNLELSKEVQNAVLGYLEEREVDDELAEFLHQYMANKDKAELLRWMKTVESCVQK